MKVVGGFVLSPEQFKKLLANCGHKVPEDTDPFKAHIWFKRYLGSGQIIPWKDVDFVGYPPGPTETVHIMICTSMRIGPNPKDSAEKAETPPFDQSLSDVGGKVETWIWEKTGEVVPFITVADPGGDINVNGKYYDFYSRK